MKKNTIRIAVMLLVSVAFSSAVGQESTPTPTPDPMQGIWTAYGVDDGLAHHTIRSIAVAADGTVWVSTKTGMSYFDGESWTTLHDISERFMQGEWVTRRLAIAADGTVWASGVFAVGFASAE